MLRLFISSTQKELAGERRALKDYIHGDPLLRRFFEVFLFEDLPASDRRADEVYLDEVARCDVYLRLFGDEYASEDPAVPSPTHREFAHASQFGKGADDSGKHARMRALIRHAGDELIRRRFVSLPELIGGVYASLVRHLEGRELIRFGPFDTAACPGATLADLDPEHMMWFLREARRPRGFPLSENASPTELLAHLNLLNAGRPTHAAVLREPEYTVRDGFVQTLWRPVPASTGQATAQVTRQVAEALRAASEPAAREALQEAAGIKDREHFRLTYLEPLLATGWLERTIPEKPTSPNQRYRLTAHGRAWLASLASEPQP